MKNYVTQDDINMVDYFLSEKGDVERWSSWDDRKEVIKEKFPELIEAIKNVDIAEKMLTRILKSIVDDQYKYPES